MNTELLLRELLFRVSHWGEILFFEVLRVTQISLCGDITSQHDFVSNIDLIPM